MADAKKFLDEAGTQSVINEVKARLATKAPLDSPALVGTPTAPTPATSTDTTQVATTAFVQAAIDTKISGISSARVFKGSVADVASLPALSGVENGWEYSVTAAGTTTADFIEGAGKKVPAGANVAAVNTGTEEAPDLKWDLLGGDIDLSAYAPLESPAFSGTPTVPDLGAGAASNQTANKKAVDDAITAYDGTWARITSAELAEMWGD